MKIADRPFWLALAGLLTVIFALVAAIPISRILGPEGRGEIYTALAVSAIVGALASAGTGSTLRITYIDQSGRLGVRFVLQAFLAVVLTWLALTAMTQTLGFQLVTSIDNFLLAVSSGLNVASVNLISILLARHTYLIAGLVMTITPLGQLLAAMSFQLSGQTSLISWLVAFLTLSSFASLIAALFASREFRAPDRQVDFSFRRSIHNFAPSLLQHLANRLDLALATILFGTVFGGLYSLALMVAVPLFFVQPTLLGAYLNSHVASAQSEDTGLILQIRGQLERVLSLGVLIAVVMATIATMALVPLFGPPFAEAVSISWFLVISSTLAIGAIFTSELLVGSGLGQKSLRSSVISTVSFIPLAVISSFSSLIFPLLVLLWYLTILLQNIRHLGLSPLSLRLSRAKALKALSDAFSRPRI